MKKTLVLLLVVVLAAGLALSFVGCADKEEKEYKLTGGTKAIIILPGLLASGLYDSQTGEMLWDPFSSKASDDMDLMAVLGAYGEMGLGDFVSSMSSVDYRTALSQAARCINDNPERPGVLRRIMCDQEGNPSPEVAPVPYEYEGHQRYGALNSYRTMAQNLERLYGDKYQVTVFNYNWLTDTRTAATQLADYMKENNMTESILVAHSMGGIVGTEFLAQSAENRARIDKFITLATPFYGSYSVNSWFEDASFLKEMAIPALKELGLEQFIKKFDAFFDNLVVPMLYNMTSMYQLLPSAELVELMAQTEISAYTVDGKALAADELYEFYLTRPWSTLSPLATPQEAALLSPRKQMAEWQQYRDGFYVQKKGEKIFACDLVDSYYIAGKGVSTIQGVSYTDSGMVEHYSQDGDGTVSFLSATRGLAPDNEHVFVVDGVSHIVLGCYFDGQQAEYLQAIISR